jgi:hypothetical protein
MRVKEGVQREEMPACTVSLCRGARRLLALRSRVPPSHLPSPLLHISVCFLRAQASRESSFARALTVRHPYRRSEALYRSLQGIPAEIKVWHAIVSFTRFLVCQGFLLL